MENDNFGGIVDKDRRASIELIPGLSPDGKPVPPETKPLILSPSDAKILCTRTPLHAWQAKRALGGGSGHSSDATEDGKIYEAMIFGNGPEVFEVHDVKAFQSNDAKAAKADTESRGRIALKSADFQEMSEGALAMLRGIEAADVKFSGGKFQAEICWTSDGVDCHAFLDYLILGPDYYVIYDLKTVADASNEKVIPAMTNYGWDIQAAACIEGVETVYPHLAGRGVFRDVFCEKTKPYAVNVPPLSGGFLELGRRRWARAKGIWKECVATGIWPGYTNTPIEPLPWQLSKEPVEQEVEA